MVGGLVVGSIRQSRFADYLRYAPKPRLPDANLILVVSSRRKLRHKFARLRRTLRICHTCPTIRLEPVDNPNMRPFQLSLHIYDDNLESNNLDIQRYYDACTFYRAASAIHANVWRMDNRRSGSCDHSTLRSPSSVQASSSIQRLMTWGFVNSVGNVLVNLLVLSPETLLRPLVSTVLAPVRVTKIIDLVDHRDIGFKHQGAGGGVLLRVRFYLLTAEEPPVHQSNLEPSPT